MCLFLSWSRRHVCRLIMLWLLVLQLGFSRWISHSMSLFLLALDYCVLLLFFLFFKILDPFSNTSLFTEPNFQKCVQPSSRGFEQYWNCNADVLSQSARLNRLSLSQLFFVHKKQKRTKNKTSIRGCLAFVGSLKAHVFRISITIYLLISIRLLAFESIKFAFFRRTNTISLVQPKETRKKQPFSFAVFIEFFVVVVVDRQIRTQCS